MKDILAIEWLKIKKYRTFWVLIILYVVLLPVWNYQIFNGMIKIGGGGLNFLSQAYSFPQVWGNIGFWGSIFITFLSILVIILTTNEYTFRTNRQNVIDGWKRIDFFHAKIWLVVVISLLATLYLLVLGILFGLINSGSLGDMFKEIEQVGYFFLLSVNYLGFALLISIWIKRSGLAISLFLLYSLIIENILKPLLNWKSGDLKLGNYLPLQASDEMLPFPLMKMAQAMMQMTTPTSMTGYIIATIIWCLVYYFAARAILLRSDW